MDNISIQFNSDISKDNTEIRIAFYANIGFFIELAQMLEFNLRKLLCYELTIEKIEKEKPTKKNISKIYKKYDDYYFKTYEEKWTLGKLKDELERSSSLSPNTIDSLKEINDYRILIVHKIFQNNIISGNLRDSAIVHNYIENRLIPITNQANDINKEIIEFIKLYQNKLQTYKEQIQ